jgi:hypothetical protein
MSDRKSSRDRFVVLAEKRVTKLIKQIRLLGNLSNKSNYSYTAEDSRKILSAVDSEVRVLRKRFGAAEAADEIKFKL